jgi:type VI secretion system protein VasD
MNRDSKHARFLQWLVTGLVLLLITACGAKETPPPPAPPPEPPTSVILEIETAGDINPNPMGRPSPLVLRIYQLKSPAGFEKADFMSLYEKEEAVLGRDLIKKEEIMLKVQEMQTIPIEVENDTGALGLMAVFRNYEQSQWKAAAAIIRHQPNRMSVHISGNTLTVK